MNRVCNAIKLSFQSVVLLLKKNGRIHSPLISNISITTEVQAINNGYVQLGKKVATLSHVSLVANGGKLIIEDNVGINRNCIFICRDNITIGSGCAFGPNVVIFDHDHEFDKKSFKMNQFRTSPITIGKNCWIGANVTILRGTHIGEGTVIGAGTIVKGDIPPHSLVTSNREFKIRSIER